MHFSKQRELLGVLLLSVRYIHIRVVRIPEPGKVARATWAPLLIRKLPDKPKQVWGMSATTLVLSRKECADRLRDCMQQLLHEHSLQVTLVQDL